MKELFLRIKRLTKEKGTNIFELQNTLGFGCRSIYNWKDKKSPLLENVLKVAEHYDVSLDYLVGRTPNRMVFKKEYSEAELDLLEDICSLHLDEEKLSIVKSYLSTLDKSESEE